jgi:4-amino-4-deoxy-L-arabinose transferase-like glycosyltransferase
MLTKGPQAPVYFVAGVGLFLLVMRRGRELFRWQHVAGVAVFLAIWLAWEIPFCLRVTRHEAWTMLMGDVAMRFEDESWKRTLKHVFEFPLSVAACMLPWGVLLLAYIYRDFRRSIVAVRADVWFLSLSIGFAFLSCYVVPGARNRYLAPMLPLFALLIGLAAQQCCAAAASEPMRRLRRHYFIFAGVLSAGIGIWIVAATVLRLGAFKGQQPMMFALLFTLAAVAVTAIAFWNSRGVEVVREQAGVLTLAVFLGLTYMGAVMNIFVATRHPIDAEVAAMITRLPKDVELVSIGPVDDVFLYYYGRPIRRLPAAEGIGHKERRWTWFCMGCGPKMPTFDPPYEQIDKISVETAYCDNPHDVVIIGRRLSDTTAEKPAGSVR